MRKSQYFLIFITLCILSLSGCSLLTQPKLSKIEKYENRIVKQYSDSVYTEVIVTKGLDFIFEEQHVFPYKMNFEIELQDTFSKPNEYTLEYYYKNPNKNVVSFQHKWNFSESLDEGKYSSTMRGDGVILEGYFKDYTLVAGIYEYYEIFTLGNARYEFVSKFYYDPETMKGGAGTPQNNGYWISEKSNR